MKTELKVIVFAILCWNILFLKAQTVEQFFQNERTQVAVGTEYCSDFNPILPLWEHIPDGEPHIFEDPDFPGKYRVYLYGSHDTRKVEYCGTDLVVWSAPIEDLTRWRYDGVIYANNNFPEDPRIMFAPDVVEKKQGGIKRYYLFPNEQRMIRADVAIAEKPTGPFVSLANTGIFWADPAALVDDDGKVYAYWGFKKSLGAELDPNTMYTVKSGTSVVENMIGNQEIGDKMPHDSVTQSKQFRFFEASSIRKIGHMYVFVYSRFPHPSENRHGGQMLAYAYSTHPLGPWTYGGPIIASGSTDNLSPMGNIHGGIVQVGKQWYVFYHRHTNHNWYARQACVEPIDIRIEGNTVRIDEVPCTSQGFNVSGLDPYKKYPAGIACSFIGKAYVKATYDTQINCNPIVNIYNNDVLGYKYYNFDLLKGDYLQVQLDFAAKNIAGSVEVWIDYPSKEKGGTCLGSLNIIPDSNHVIKKYTAKLSNVKKLCGKHAVYLVFHSDEDKEICDLYYLKFS